MDAIDVMITQAQLSRLRYVRGTTPDERFTAEALDDLRRMESQFLRQLPSIIRWASNAVGNGVIDPVLAPGAPDQYGTHERLLNGFPTPWPDGTTFRCSIDANLDKEGSVVTLEDMLSQTVHAHVIGTGVAYERTHIWALATLPSGEQVLSRCQITVERPAAGGSGASTATAVAKG